MTTRKTKLWIGLGAFVLAAQTPALVETPALESGKAQATADPTALRLAQGTGTTKGGACGEENACASKGGEGGEDGEGGEGGEGGEAGAPADPVQDDAAYLHQLGQIRGHLAVGVELYRQGEKAAAATHMKHPGDEIYAELRPALEARHAPDVGPELERLALAVEGGAPREEVEAAYSAATARLDEAEAAAPGAKDPSVVLEATHRLVKTAADEYAEGVEGDRVVEAHEYQDAFGFVRTAKATVARLKLEGAGDREILAKVERELAALDPAWPALVPPSTFKADPSLLYGAAARIEIALLSAEW